MGAGQVPGGTSGAGQVRPLTVVETSVSVDANETTLKAANASRRNLVVQNCGPDIVQVYLTTGKTFGVAGIQLAPGSATVVGGIWEAAQEYGVYQGIVYARCDAGNTATVNVTEET